MIHLLVAGALTLTSAPVTDGYGWELGSGITHLDSAGWSVQFYDTYSRDQLRSTMLLTAAELEAKTGIDFYVGYTVNKTDAGCPGYTSTGRHRIVVRLDPVTERSNATHCYLNGAVHSSRVLFSKANWDNKTRSGSHLAYRRNVSSHELGHSVGLSHPNEEYVTGADPLMSGNHWGGYATAADAYKYTPYDVKGLKQLVVNRP